MKNKWWIITGLMVLLIAVSILSLSIGPAQTTEIIFWQIRLPRVWIGVVVGGALAVAGVVYQAILRNPLADPFMLGTSSGASLGVILAGSLGSTSPLVFYSSAMVGAWGAVQLVCGISRGARTQSVASFALSGVVVSTFLNAVVFIIFVLSLHESFSALFFLLGTLTVYDASLTWISTILIGLCAGWFLTQTHALNVMTQGDLTAQSLGLNVRRLRSVYFVVASVLVAGSVTLAGMIGFVGLLVPHILRMLIGPNHRMLIPASFLGGGILLVSLDAFARVIASPRELPVGIFTALCGAPFFLYLLYKKQGEVF